MGQFLNKLGKEVGVVFRFRASGIASNGYDVALIRLPRHVVTHREDPQERVLPICLPWTNKEQAFSSQNVVIGWGKTNNDAADTGDRFDSGVFSRILQQLVVPDVPHKECKAKFYKNIHPEKHICAGGERGKDTCKGDSGGPLISRQGKSGPMYLKGIISFGTTQCGTGFPGTNIAKLFFRIAERQCHFD